RLTGNLLSFPTRRSSDLLVEVASLPMFWLKAGAPLAIALAGVALVHRLGRPGMDGGLAWWGVVLPVALLWLAGAWQWLGAAPAEDRKSTRLNSRHVKISY